jgi:hypothetical protein
VVISIVEQVKTNPSYSLQVSDIEAWEKTHGHIPEGSSLGRKRASRNMRCHAMVRHGAPRVVLCWKTSPA